MGTRRPKPKPGSRPRLVRYLFAVFLVLCLTAVGWRILRPVLWPRIHPMNTRQTSERMYDDNTLFR